MSFSILLESFYILIEQDNFDPAIENSFVDIYIYIFFHKKETSEVRRNVIRGRLNKDYTILGSTR